MHHGDGPDHEEGVASQDAGELVDALQTFTELSLTAPGYHDVGMRISEIKRLLSPS